MGALRTLIGTLFIKAGMLIVPRDVRQMVRGILLYHVPGALTDAERSDVIEAKSAWRRTQ